MGISTRSGLLFHLWLGNPYDRYLIFIGHGERRSQERQEQQPGPHLSPGPAEELKCPESDTAGRCISGSDLTIMDSVHQELPRAFRSFCSISEIHIKCGCQKQSLGEGAE